VIARAVLRASQLRSLGAGQRWLVERELTVDGRIHQRVNEGTPEPTRSWKVIGRWTELDAERARLVAEGWEVEPSRPE